LGNRDDLACLIPCAIDQDPYFRVTRDIAHKIAPKSHPLKGKPALIHSKFFPPLQGAMGKMSSSDDNSAIFLTDDDATIERKIMTHAFSGGRETAKLQRELGADLEVDVAFQWLKFFLEDDGELASIEAQYGSGSGDYWNTAAVKKRLVVELQGLVKDHQAKRNVLTDADVASWMAVRELAPAL
jgi:tryptophanyl-tRNA synthetase